MRQVSRAEARTQDERPPVSEKRIETARRFNAGDTAENFKSRRDDRKLLPSLRDFGSFDGSIPALKCRAIFKMSCRDKASRLCVFVLNFFGYGAERMRQKLFVMASGALGRNFYTNFPVLVSIL